MPHGPDFGPLAIDFARHDVHLTVVRGAGPGRRIGSNAKDADADGNQYEVRAFHASGRLTPVDDGGEWIICRRLRYGMLFGQQVCENGLEQLACEPLDETNLDEHALAESY